MPHKPSFDTRRCAKQTSGNSRKSGVFAPDLVQPRQSAGASPISSNLLTGALNTLLAALIARWRDVICYRHSVIARRRRYTLTGAGWGTYRFAERK
jgi:hypothetical protein